MHSIFLDFHDYCDILRFMKKLTAIILGFYLLTSFAIFANGKDEYIAINTPSLQGSLNSVYVLIVTPKGKGNESFAKLSPGDLSLYQWADLTKNPDGTYKLSAADIENTRYSEIQSFNYQDKSVIIKKIQLNRQPATSAQLINFNYHIAELVGDSQGVTLLGYSALMKVAVEKNLAAGKIRIEKLSLKDGRIYGTIGIITN